MVKPTRLRMLVELEPETAKPHVWAALTRHAGNITQAAAELDISTKSLWRILHLLGLYERVVAEWPGRRATRATGTVPRSATREGENEARVARKTATKAAKKRTPAQRKKL